MPPTFVVGRPAPAAVGVLDAPLGGGRAVLARDGVRIAVRVASPTAAQREAVEGGAVALGVLDGPSGAAFRVSAGAGGADGGARAVVEASADVRFERGALVRARRGTGGSTRVELALCDTAGVVRAVRTFEGPTAPARG